MDLYSRSISSYLLMVRRSKSRMKRKMWAAFALAIAWSATVSHLVAQASNNSVSAKASTVFSRELPKLDGGQLAAKNGEFNEGPGGSSSPHSHPFSVIFYVLKTDDRSYRPRDPEAI